MAHQISSECVSCGACAANCPVDAISAGAKHYEIDPEKCVDCGSCAEACPMSAISK
ncbi:MAG: 4Fe-4S binding protein [Oscillospiraceae bacterium]|jgi:ferredoxin|nr:4Fe-4S binding protein [Oscillospiraceae bacterium]